MTSERVRRWRSAPPASVRAWRTAGQHVGKWRRIGGEPADFRRRFSTIESAITDSRRLLSLPEDWDDEGAARVTELTLQKASGVLRRAAAVVFRRFGYILPAPSIAPCSDGSVDIFWRTEGFTLLINVSANGPHASNFYGEKGGVEVKGPFDPDAPDFEFLYWLAA